jgi:hypothetical protein
VLALNVSQGVQCWPSIRIRALELFLSFGLSWFQQTWPGSFAVLKLLSTSFYPLIEEASQLLFSSGGLSRRCG